MLRYQAWLMICGILLGCLAEGWTADAEAGMVRIVVRTGAQEFIPQRITIRPDDQVTWVNADQDTHSVISAGAGSQLTGTGSETPLINANLPPGASYTFAFHEAGSYYYFCANHMQAWGIVVAGDSFTAESPGR